MRPLLRRLLVASVLFSSPTFAGLAANQQLDYEEASADPSPGSLSMPLVFLGNRGQFDDTVLFQARLPRANVLVHSDGWSVAGDSPVRMRFETDRVGGASAVGLERLAARATYISGGLDAIREIDAPIFQRVRLDGLQPGLDLELFDRSGRLEYDLFLAAGVPVEQIAFTLEGVDASSINAAGELVFRAGGREARQARPITYELDAHGRRHEISSRFRSLGGHRYGFELDGRDPSRAVVIDPVLLFSEFIGGSGADVATDIVLDAEGSMYMTGWSKSADFAGTEHRVRGRDVVIFKLAPMGLSSSGPRTGAEGGTGWTGGLELVYATFLTGAGDDEGLALKVNGAGEVFVVGKTRSADFPTTSQVLQGQRAGGTDAFAARLSADGRTLLWSTFIGGSGDDSANALALGASDSILIAGTTRSKDFPSSSFALQTGLSGGQDAFVLRLDGGGQFLLFSTYLGGHRDDVAHGLALDSNGNAYITGRTDSLDFPTTSGAFDSQKNSAEAFVVKLGRVGDALIYSTFLGGGGQDEGHAIALDQKERAWVAGWTMSDDFPTTEDALQPRRGGSTDGFLACVSPSGSRLDYSTFLGGSGKDEVFGLALDVFDAPWVTGRTESDDLSVTADSHATQRAGGGDAFLIGIQEDTGRLNYGTYLGWSGDELGAAIAVQPGTESVVLVGYAESIAPSLRGPLSGQRRGARDAFLARFEPGVCSGPAIIAELGAGVGLQLSITRPRLGKSFEVSVSGGPKNARGLLLFSSGDPVPTSLEEIATLQVDPNSMNVLMRFSTDQEGNWEFQGSLPADAELCGERLVVQAITLHRASGPLNFGQISQGFSLTLGN